MIINLGESRSIINQFIAEIRDENIQKDRMRFRRNLERIGEYFAYEISKKLQYSAEEVKTPLGLADAYLLSENIVLSTILRAGLPIHNGLLNIFDKAENAFISAYRKYEKDGTFEIQVEYISSPDTEGKTIIISDPMLASGASMVLACKALIDKGRPKHIHIVTAIASKEGIEYVSKHLDMSNVTIWVGDIDDELTVKSYIVPGLGDAGDLAFGSKN